MILKSSMLKYTFIIGFSVLSINTFAQVDTTKTPDSNTQQATTIEEVEVIRDYRPILADAVKIRRSPSLSDTRTFQPSLNYNIVDKRLNFPSGMGQLTIQELQSGRPDIMTNNYAKLGIGNFNTILGEVYVNTGTADIYQAGFYAKHLGQKGDLEGQKFSEQNIGVFGKRIMDAFTLKGEVGYNRFGTAFYGYIPETYAEAVTPENQTFSDFYLSGELLKNYDPQDDDVSYSLKADAYLFSDAFNAKENSFAISGYLNKAIQAFNLGANVSADLTTVKATDYSQQNNIVRLNPYIRFQGDNYKLTLGANFVAESNDTSRTNLFPFADFELDVVPQFASIFGGVKGDVTKTSLRTLAQDNPFLNENININNMVDRLHIFAGVKGNLGATFGYKAKFFYRKIEDMPLFVNNTSDPTRFDVIYDQGIDEATSISGFEGEINVRVSQTVNIGGKINLSEYKLSTEEEPWFMPAVRISSDARINISEKVFLTGEVFFNGETSARYLDPLIDYVGEIPYSVRKMPAFVNINAGAEYRITNQFGIFVQANNLLNDTYQKYLYYPRLGFNVIGGLNYSF